MPVESETGSQVWTGADITDEAAVRKAMQLTYWTSQSHRGVQIEEYQLVFLFGTCHTDRLNPLSSATSCTTSATAPLCLALSCCTDTSQAQLTCTLGRHSSDAAVASSVTSAPLTSSPVVSNEVCERVDGGAAVIEWQTCEVSDGVEQPRDAQQPHTACQRAERTQHGHWRALSALDCIQ